MAAESSVTDWRQLAQRQWPRADYVCGDGEFAVLRYCSSLDIVLVSDELGAYRERRKSCGVHSCYWDHALVQIIPKAMGEKPRTRRLIPRPPREMRVPKDRRFRGY